MNLEDYSSVIEVLSVVTKEFIVIVIITVTIAIVAIKAIEP